MKKWSALIRKYEDVCSAKNNLNKCKYNKRYTLDEARDIFINHGLTPLFTEYKTNVDKLPCESKEGYRGFIRLNSLLTGQGISWFHHSNSYTIYNIHVFIKNNNLQCTLLTDKWISHNHVLKLLCHVCNEEFEQTWGNFRKGKTKYCYNCHVKKATELVRNSIAQVKQDFVNRGYVPLFDEYTSNKDKLLVRDLDGYLGVLSYHKLMSGAGFDRFHPKNPYVYDNICHYIKTKNMPSRYVSGKYLRNTSILVFECECGERFSTAWAVYTNVGKIRCDTCSNSKSALELLTEEWLRENNIQFDTQVKLNGCLNKIPLRFDFGVVGKNGLVLIECQGEQHYKPLDYFGGEEGFAYRQQNDQIKRDYCKNNGFKLIEIPYTKYTNDAYKTILQEELTL